ncbi:MAG: hypothetical protein WAO71_14235 [Gallionella sp.]
MPSPSKVLIIESRTSEDKKAARSEQPHLENTFKLLGISTKKIEVSTPKGFYSAIKKAETEHIHYVHFSGHGCSDGIQLGDSLFITWKEIDDNCWPSLRGTCFSFSSCDVAKGVEALFGKHKTFCAAIVAATRKVYWAESAVAFSAFFLKATNPGTSTERDVNVMNHICGAGTFKLFRASVGNETKIL